MNRIHHVEGDFNLKQQKSQLSEINGVVKFPAGFLIPRRDTTLSSFPQAFFVANRFTKFNFKLESKDLVVLFVYRQV